MRAMTSVTSKETSLRSPFWMAISWLLGLTALLIGVSGMGVGSVGEIVFLGLLAGVPGGWVTIRVPMMRVTLSSTGLTNHGMFRNQTFAWADIQRVRVEEVDDKIIAIVYAPVFDLRTNPDGHALMQLAGYSLPGYSTKEGGVNFRVTRQAKLIEQRLSQWNSSSI